MEQVFDLREFVIKLVKKFKLALILCIVFAILGAAFGYLKYPGEVVKTSSSAGISFVDKTQDATALSSATANINQTLTYDAYYVELVEEMSSKLDKDEVDKLFYGDATPKINDVKDIISVYVKGSVVYADVKTTDLELSKKASDIAIQYTIETLPSLFEGVEAKFLRQQTFSLSKQNNDSLVKDIIKFAILGFGGGLVLGILVLFFVEVIDLRVKNDYDLKKFSKPVFHKVKLTISAITKKTAKEKFAVAVVSSSQEVSVNDIAIDIKNAITGRNAIVVDVKNDTEFENDIVARERLNDLFRKFDCVILSVDNNSFNALAVADCAVLVEQRKLSKTDEIANTIENMTALGLDCIGFILK